MVVLVVAAVLMWLMLGAIDGSPDSVAAVRLEARQHLEHAAATVAAATGRPPVQAVLAGEPADALQRYAVDEGYDVIVVGCRGRGLSHLVMGSCATNLARTTGVPVVLVPRRPDEPRQGDAPGRSTSTSRR